MSEQKMRETIAVHVRAAVLASCAGDDMDTLCRDAAEKIAAIASQVTQGEAVASAGWYCAHCQQGVDPSEVTFNEAHPVCGRIITDDEPPAVPDGLQARVTAESLDSMYRAGARAGWNAAHLPDEDDAIRAYQNLTKVEAGSFAAHRELRAMLAAAPEPPR